MNPYTLPYHQRIRAFDDASGSARLFGRYDALGNRQESSLRGLAAKATDPQFANWRAENPALAAYHRRRDSFDHRDSWQHMLGSGVANRLGNPDNSWKSLMRRGPLVGGLAAGLGAGAITLGGLWALNRLGITPDGATRPGALGAAAAGAALGGFSGSRHRREKMASLNTRQDILDALRRDTRTSFEEKARLQRGIMSLSNAELSRLSRIISMAGVASVGALVAKFLMNAGKGGMLMGALAGGAVGNALSQRNNFTRNAAGQRTRPGLNVFGNSF